MTNETEMVGLKFMNALKLSNPKRYSQLLEPMDTAGVRLSVIPPEAMNDIINNVGLGEMRRLERLTDKWVEDRRNRIHTRRLAEGHKNSGGTRFFTAFRPTNNERDLG